MPMDNVVNFPSKTVRDWVVIERELILQLQNAGAPPSVRDRLVEKMKAFRPILDRDFDISVPTPPIRFPLIKRLLFAPRSMKVCGRLSKNNLTPSQMPSSSNVSIEKLKCAGKLVSCDTLEPCKLAWYTSG